MSQNITIDAPPSSDRRSAFAEWLPIAIVIVTILFVAAIRLRIADTPLERDEGEFAYAGQLIRQGEVPYKYCYNIKLPGTYAAYAAIMTLFGETPIGIHFGLLLVNGASIALIYLIGKKVDSKISGAVAAVLFALFSLDPALYGFAAHATHFVVFFTLLGFYFFFRAIETESPLMSFISGISMGISFICKQPGFAFGLMACGFIAWQSIKRKKRSLLALYIVGWLAPFALVCLIMWISGAFEVFWLWTVKYAGAHSRSLSQLFPSLTSALRACPVRVRAVGFVVAPALIYMLSVRTVLLWKRLFILALVVSGLAAVTLGFYFYLHYFIMLIPAAALVIAVALNAASTELRLRFLPWAAVACWAAFTIVTLSDYLFVNSPDKIIATRYVGNPFVQARRIANYLTTNCPPNAGIAILQGEPEILVYSQRRSSTGFIYAYDLTAPSPVRFDLEDEFKRDLIASDPEYIVFVADPFSWTPQDRAGLALADWCYAFANSNSTPIAIADGLTPAFNETVYKWGTEAQSYKRQSDTFIEVYRRNR